MVVQTLIYSKLILITLLEYIERQCGYKVNMSFIDVLGHDWHLEHGQRKPERTSIDWIKTGNEIVLIRKFSAVVSS